MCHFVTLVVEGGDEATLRQVLIDSERRLDPIENPTVAALMQPGERQYLTAQSCDCGTALGSMAYEEAAIRGELERQRARLSRLKWSDAKMERWVRDRAKADDRKAGARRSDLENWDALLTAIADVGVRRAALLLHCYSGALNVEFDCTRQSAKGSTSRIDQLACMEEDILTDFAVG